MYERRGVHYHCYCMFKIVLLYFASLIGQMIGQTVMIVIQTCSMI